MSQPVMIFHVIIDRSAISELEAVNGKAVIIPFGGYTESEIFKGRILPGAADVQTLDASGIRHMCAKYMFEGIDQEGRKCRLFVENNGYFERNSQPSPFHAYPVFLSDSPYLNDLLGRAVYRSEGHPTKEGVDIRIFDVTKDDGQEYTEEAQTLDPYILELTQADIPQEIRTEAHRIQEEERVVKMIFFSSHDSQTYVLEEPDENVIAGVLNSLRGTPQMAYLFNERGELAAVSFIAGKVRNIAEAALTVFAQIFEETGGSRYFDHPIHRYPRWRINEL